MLRSAGSMVECEGASVCIKDAAFPVPFSHGLEFNSPVHGNWNIVHTGMLVPEARQIYVCADNCMRGVVLTAAEMNAADRFSFVILEEDDLLNGNLEDITIEGTTDVLNRLEKKPKAVLLFTVCLHHFVGSDLDRIYGELEKRFPDIFFMRCFMDPIMQKTGLTPDQKLRRAMYDGIAGDREESDCITVLGSDFSLDESSDIRRILLQNGKKLQEITACHTWEEYRHLGNGSLFVNCYPPGKVGAEYQAQRLEKPFLYLPGSFDYEEIRKLEEKLIKALGMEKGLDIQAEQERCEVALKKAHEVIGDTAVVLDQLFHPRPLGLAKLLISHGFRVERIYLDSISAEEREDFLWLQKNVPELVLTATIQAKMRVVPRESKHKVLAIGQKAAWFSGSRNFVNMVQGGGLWGYDGICRVAELMIDAFEHEKDTEELVVRKGWGCESCI